LNWGNKQREKRTCTEKRGFRVKQQRKEREENPHKIAGCYKEPNKETKREKNRTKDKQVDHTGGDRI